MDILLEPIDFCKTITRFIELCMILNTISTTKFDRANDGVLHFHKLSSYALLCISIMEGEYFTLKKFVYRDIFAACTKF